jgi:hypothetical protein
MRYRQKDLAIFNPTTHLIPFNGFASLKMQGLSSNLFKKQPVRLVG